LPQRLAIFSIRAPPSPFLPNSWLAAATMAARVSRGECLRIRLDEFTRFFRVPSAEVGVLIGVYLSRALGEHRKAHVSTMTGGEF
jgi:hypothetical protein